MLPSGLVVIPQGSEKALERVYSVILPVAGEILAILFSIGSENQMLPCGPAVISWAIGPTNWVVVPEIVVVAESGTVDVTVEVVVCVTVDAAELHAVNAVNTNTIASRIEHANKPFLFI